MNFVFLINFLEIINWPLLISGLILFIFIGAFIFYFNHKNHSTEVFVENNIVENNIIKEDWRLFGSEVKIDTGGILLIIVSTCIIFFLIMMFLTGNSSMEQSANYTCEIRGGYYMPHFAPNRATCLFKDKICLFIIPGRGARYYHAECAFYRGDGTNLVTNKRGLFSIGYNDLNSISKYFVDADSVEDTRQELINEWAKLHSKRPLGGW